MPRTSPLTTLDTVMICLRDSEKDLAAGITRTEHAARTEYDANTLILLRRARRTLNHARTELASVHPQGIPGWQPPHDCPGEEE